MTREEMKNLKGLAASMGLYDDKNPCKRAVILGKAIKELEQEPRWIPVSERLPEERGFYIVTEKVFSLNHKGRYNTKVEQVEYSNGKWQRASFFEVVAWMPLPKAYES